jgi:acetate kinase
MRALLASAAPSAKLAVDLYVYRIRREIGSLAAALGGLDAIVFTGGIGEHAAVIRERVCQDAAWLGVELDAAAKIDRFSLAIDVIDRVPRLRVAGAHVKEKLRNMQIDCQSYAYQHDVDEPEVDQWTWPKVDTASPPSSWW